VAKRPAPTPASTLDAHVQDLQGILYSCADDLPHARNGRPVASGDAYADDVLKKMKDDNCAAIRKVLAVLLAFINRGSRRTTVRLFAQRLDAILARHGAEDEPRPLRFLNRKETREDGMFDLAQLRIEADPDDLQSLEALVRQGAYYRAAVDELIEEAMARIVVLRAGNPTEPHLRLMES
jgi:hypothetical protein